MARGKEQNVWSKNGKKTFFTEIIWGLSLKASDSFQSGNCKNTFMGRNKLTSHTHLFQETVRENVMDLVTL